MSLNDVMKPIDFCVVFLCLHSMKNILVSTKNIELSALTYSIKFEH